MCIAIYILVCIHNVHFVRISYTMIYANEACKSLSSSSLEGTTFCSHLIFYVQSHVKQTCGPGKQRYLLKRLPSKASKRTIATERYGRVLSAASCWRHHNHKEPV